MSEALLPTVLITNDDGPPSDESPYLYGFIQALQTRLRWRCRVVIPSSQRSWVGKAYMIKDQIEGEYFYPQGPEGRSGERCATRKEGSQGEWVLLNGTPATAANIALNNIYPNECHLCISGPNFGRNTSSAFAMSSGTVGAAMAAALNGVPAVALSYGIFQKPVDPAIVDKAHEGAVTVIEQLWKSGFPGNGPALYNVNVPLLPALIEQHSPVIRWTTMAEKKYGRLFQPEDERQTSPQKESTTGGPSIVTEAPDVESDVRPLQAGERLRFKFAPDLRALVNPSADSLIEGTDIHAITHCAISVTPLRAAYAGAEIPLTLKATADAKGQWKL